MADGILKGLCMANDEKLMNRALKCSKYHTSNKEGAKELIEVVSQFNSEEIITKVLELVKKSIAYAEDNNWVRISSILGGLCTGNDEKFMVRVRKCFQEIQDRCVAHEFTRVVSKFNYEEIITKILVLVKNTATKDGEVYLYTASNFVSDLESTGCPTSFIKDAEKKSSREL